MGSVNSPTGSFRFLLRTSVRGKEIVLRADDGSFYYYFRRRQLLTLLRESSDNAKRRVNNTYDFVCPYTLKTVIL